MREVTCRRKAPGPGADHDDPSSGRHAAAFVRARRSGAVAAR